MASAQKYKVIVDAFLEAVAEHGYKIEKNSVGDDKVILYAYHDGYWALISGRLEDSLESIMLTVCNDNDFPFAEKKKQIWVQVKTTVPLMPIDALDANGFIVCKNGTVDPATGDMYEHDPDHYSTRNIAIEYDPMAECPAFLAMLDRVLADKDEKTREQYLAFLQRWFGLAIAGYRRFDGRPYRKMILLVGDPGTGKSSITDIIEAMFGKHEVARSTIHQLGTRFGLTNVVKAKAIIGDDAIDSKTKMNSLVFKRLATGEAQEVDLKGRDPISFVFNGPIIFTANEIPRVEDSNHALYGRIVVLKFENPFSPEDLREHFGHYKKPIHCFTAEGEMPGILNWALDGLRKVISDDETGLPTIDESVASGNAWRMQEDPVFAFLHECCTEDERVANSLDVIGAACSAYASTNMGIVLAPTQARPLLSREAKKVYPNLARSRKTWDAGQQRVLQGLRLNEAGLHWVEQAQQRNLLVAKMKYRVNEALV